MSEQRYDLDDPLYRLWCAAVDAAESADFRDDEGELDEEKYLHKQASAIERARNALFGRPDSECPECFAIIAPGRLMAHEYWHDSTWPRSGGEPGVSA